jgi:hypothetical protein
MPPPAGQALIGAQFTTCCRWCGVPYGNSLMPFSWRPGGWESGGSSAKIISAYPACRWYSPAAAGAAANVAGLSVIRNVLLGVLFVLWTAWWISVLVVFARQSHAGSTTSL